jgi:hypothetical protein
MATIHITRGTTGLGTFSEEEVREGLRTGRFIPTDLGWREGMSTWEQLAKFPEFATGATPPAPRSEAGSTITPVGPAADTPAPRSGLPWDNRAGRPFFGAFIETLQMVLTRPGVAFTAMKREGGLFDPLIYAVIGGSFGVIVSLLFGFLLQSIGFAADRQNALAGFIGMGVGFVFLIIFMPVLVAIGVFVWSAILHLCLMIVGGAKQSFETTFRIVCYSSGSTYPFVILPFCGGLIAGVWRAVLDCIGIIHAHETDTGRAVLAVVLPIIVCCGGMFLLFMLGAFGASMMSHH